MDDQHTREPNKNQDNGQLSGASGGNNDGNQNQESGLATMARNVGEQAWSAASGAGAAVSDVARRARDLPSTATDNITRNVNEYPLAALVIAGAVGYGLAYLVHNRWGEGWGDWTNWTGGNNDNDNRRDKGHNDRNQNRRHRD